MNVTCQREGLLSACKIVEAAIPSRTTIPVYQNIKAVAEDDRLTLMATDLDIGIRYELRGLTVHGHGEAILPAARLSSILRESAGDEIEIEADASQIRIRTQASEFNLPTEDPGLFSDVPVFDSEAYHEVSAGDLQRMIRRTVFAAAKDEGKYAMRGILWEMEEKLVRIVGSDSKRLAVNTAAGAAQGEPEKLTAILPVKAMSLLARILAEGDDSQAVRVCLRNNDALFATEKAAIYSRLVEGRFPPWSTVIPKKANIKVPLVVGEFLSAVRQAAIVTDEESKRIEFAFSKGKVTLKASGKKVSGTSEVTLALPDFAGPAVKIMFDPAYLIDALKSLDSGSAVRLDMVDGEKSAVFRCGDDFLYLVVPLV